MAWWEEFFDEAYVHRWSAAGAFDRTPQEVESLVGLLDLPRGAAILDVPCGFGRMAGPLHQRGFRVTGIDVSRVQLRLAAQRNPGPRYLRADMRHPPAGPFDAVVNYFSSFGYFDEPADDRAALAAWQRVLRPGGVLVMELMHRDRVAFLEGAGDATTLPGEAGETDWVAGVRTSQVSVGGHVRTLRLRLYTATGLADLLRATGFARVEAFGDLRRAPLSPHTRLVVRAVR